MGDFWVEPIKTDFWLYLLRRHENNVQGHRFMSYPCRCLRKSTLIFNCEFNYHIYEANISWEEREEREGRGGGEGGRGER